MNVVCVIPARYESSRFPGKPLADLCGKPMIQHVYERALRSDVVSSVAVATDDKRIFDTVVKFGGKAFMTSTVHTSGTDRIAEAVSHLGLADTDVVVNIQGDQPLFEPSQIAEVVEPLRNDMTLPMSTLIYKIVREEEIFHPNAVKVVFDVDHFALYFSRAPIPYVREKGFDVSYYKHHGIYGYRKKFLDVFTKLPVGKLERLESLEQLRALEYGYKIKVVETRYDSIEVDTPQELERVRKLIESDNAG